MNDANSDNAALRKELEHVNFFLERQGYRKCDIPACNCNSWHGGNASERLREIRDALEESGIETNGVVILDLVKRIARDKERLDWLHARMDWRDRQYIFNEPDSPLSLRDLIDNAASAQQCTA